MHQHDIHAAVAIAPFCGRVGGDGALLAIADGVHLELAITRVWKLDVRMTAVLCRI